MPPGNQGSAKSKQRIGIGWPELTNGTLPNMAGPGVGKNLSRLAFQ